MLAVVVALVALLGPVGPAAASPTGDGVVALGVDTSVLWPDPADGESPGTIRLDYQVTEDGTYALWVLRGSRIVFDKGLGTLQASNEVRSFTWDGLDWWDEPVQRGTYRFAILRKVGRNTYAQDAATWPFEVRRRSATVEMRDRGGERSARHVDARWVVVRNTEQEVGLNWRFRTLDRAALRSVQIGMDVPDARRGYLVSLRRQAGSWRGQVITVLLNSDDPHHDVVRCPGLSIKVREREVDVAVPRKCLVLGGDAVRAWWSVEDRHYHADWGPAGAATYSPWVVFSPSGT